MSGTGAGASAGSANGARARRSSRCESALLIIDVINDLEFDGGDALLAQAMPMARALVGLKQRAKQASMPVIYANDNFGRWRSDFPSLVRELLDGDVRGRPLVEMLKPEPDDYFILKPRHSAFYQTNLDTLLSHLGCTRLLLTGLAGDICVLFTGNDAYMRELQIVVPSDCVACEQAEHTRQALELMKRVLKAEVRPSAEVRLDAAESPCTA